MAQDTGVPNGTVVDRLDRLLAEERRRTDNDRRQMVYELSQIALALARIELRLTAIETCCRKGLSPLKLLKLAAGIGLPLVVLLLTGNLQTALQVLSALL